MSLKPRVVPLTREQIHHNRMARVTRKSIRHKHIIIPAEDAEKITDPNTELTGGLRAPCQWCKASIPIELLKYDPPVIPDTFKLEDLTAAQRRKEKNPPNHRMRGWCSICKVYGFDVLVAL